MSWDQEVDMIVVGAGGSGLMSAIRAADAGANVLVLEKSESFGGTTALSGGCMWIPANHLQDENLGDSPDLALKYLRHLSAGTVTDTMLETYIRESRKMLRYLDRQSDMNLVACTRYCDYYPEVEGGLRGSRTVEPDPYDGQSLGKDRHRLRDPQKLTLMFGQISLTAREAHTMVTGGKQGSKLAIRKILEYILLFFLRRRRGRDRRLTLGQGLVAGLWNLARRKGVKTRFGITVGDLITENDRVAGVAITTAQGSRERIRVRRGIVLACGGFSRNQKMKEEYQQSRAEWGATVDGDTGDAYGFCRELKPATAMMNEAWWMPVMKVPGEDFARSIVVDRSLPGCIVVDQDGQRFVNESAPYEDFVRSMRGHDKATPAWLIADHFHRRNYTLGPLLPGAYYPRSFWPKGLAGNWIKVADTLEELEQLTGIPAGQLQQTVAAFNKDAGRGEDPAFGRGASAYDRYYADPSVGDNPCLRPLEAGPFYAVQLFPGDLGTKGGFVVDEKARVVSTSGEAIPGLYAAGNATANPIGNIYPGAGGTLGPGLTFGYIAAETILAEEQGNEQDAIAYGSKGS